MARYIVFWEYNVAHCPLDMKEKTSQWLILTDECKKMLKSGQIKDWAHYAGEAAGYMIVEGDDKDVLRLSDSYLPYIRCTAKSFLTLEQCEQVWKSL
jgi:hypothetical protein